MRRILFLLLVTFLAAATLAAMDPRLAAIGAALAQDDDDDDGDDDDDDGGGGGDDDDDDGGSGGGDDDDDDGVSGGGGGGRNDDDDDGRSSRSAGRDDDDDDARRRTTSPRGGGFSLLDLFRPREERQVQPRAPQRAAPAPSPPPPPPPVAAPAEIVTFDLSDDDLGTLLAQGYAVVEEQLVAGFATTSRRLSVPAGVPLAEARDTVRALPTGQDADFNHYYRVEQAENGACEGLHCPAFELIDWPLEPSRENSCGTDVAVGMIDTGINPDHETFAGSGLDLHRLSDEELDASRAIHGTAVAALLVGDPASRSPGLIPHARLVAVDAFHRAGADERAEVFTLVEALGFLAEQEVRIINLSLSGPPNTVLERTVAELVDLGIVLVAAAGNAGPQADPLFPAAYEPVIAVTAVDRYGQVYRRAGRGPHIDLAAPGIEVWTAASVSGARWKTGTSFAVPFVSAAAALMLQEDPGLTPSLIAARLADDARDLGDPGPDEIYGAGLLTLGETCRELEAQPASLID